MVLKYNGQAVGDEYKIDSTDNDAIRAKARALGASVPAVEFFLPAIGHKRYVRQQEYNSNG